MINDYSNTGQTVLNDGKKVVAIAHSKHRNSFAIVGAEIVDKEKKIYLAFAKGWDRSNINNIADDIKEYFKKFKWQKTWVDQSTGEHLINEIRKKGLKVGVINTQKEMKDPTGIKQTRIMDKVEMVQWMYEMKIGHHIKFPLHGTKNMNVLERQISVFGEHKTESGGMDYYAPGEEHDDYVRGLMILCFSARRGFLGSQKRHSIAWANGAPQEFETGLLSTQVALGKINVSSPGASPMRYKIR